MRACAQKKVKSLEQKLENEHEERLQFVREKHELENKIIHLQQIVSRAPEEEQVIVHYNSNTFVAFFNQITKTFLQLSKLKKDLKRTKALLKDAQTLMEKSNTESANKVLIRQLKNQVKG